VCSARQFSNNPVGATISNGLPGDHAGLHPVAQPGQEGQAASEKPPALPARSTRTYDEVKGVLAALRPDVVLLRDSLQVAFGEFPSRAGFYGVLNDLPTSGARPDGWKKLRGAEHWWECHVSTGQNDHGRAYARFDGLKRQWSVLLSIKKAQGHDILWLQAQ